MADAEKVMSAICPNVELRREILRCLLDSITFAEHLGLGAWAVTLFNFGFRLNVGQVEVLICEHTRRPFSTTKSYPPLVGVLTLGALPWEIIEADAAQADGIAISPKAHKNVATPQHMVSIKTNDAAQLRQQFGLVLKTHHRYIASAMRTPTGKTRTSTAYKRTHSQGLVDYANTVCAQDRHQAPQVQGDETVEDAYTEYVEGRPISFLTTRYERDKNARRACLAHHGYVCAACGFNFNAVYGEIAARYIQVHHLSPVAALGQATVIDPVADMRPLCANCHAVVHLKHPPYTIEQIRNFIAKE